jgi:hypothetical protein
MRRFLGMFLLLLVGLAALAGCGEEDDGSAQATPDDAEPELVQMLVLTSAGGEVSPTAYYVDDRAELDAYVKTFEDRDGAAAAVQQAVQDAGDTEGRLAAATVAIGCDVPEGVSITEGDQGPEVHPDKIADPKQECFAAQTSIALVEIP